MGPMMPEQFSPALNTYLRSLLPQQSILCMIDESRACCVAVLQQPESDMGCRQVEMHAAYELLRAASIKALNNSTADVPHLWGWKGRLRAYTKLRMPKRAAAVVSWRSCMHQSPNTHSP